MSDQRELFNLADYPVIENSTELKSLEAPIWTENKASLIQRYLRYFVFITHHGTYLDGFAGPQEPEHPESWAAKLVLESTPRWFRKFALFESDPKKLPLLHSIASAEISQDNRPVYIGEGDMNALLPQYLTDNPIKDSEATFCLLDQHTFECDWATVQKIATHKKQGNKIEIFYFLCQGWLDRAVSGLKKKDEDLGRWWGNDGWKELLGKDCWSRGRYLADRFKKEFGYKYALAYPIFQREDGGRIMFWMIHASDHPEAPKLMVRAYNKAVSPLEPAEQLEMELGQST